MQQSSVSDCISMAQQKNKRSIDDLEDSDRDRKRKRSSKDPDGGRAESTPGPDVGALRDHRQGPRWALRPVAEESHGPRVDQESIPAGHTSAIACQSHRIAIPSKRSCPFGKDVPRKRRKKESYVIVRAYKQRKDLEHTDEVECALTPDGDLDLVSVSRKLSVRECQASRFNAIPFRGPCSLLLEGPGRPLFTAMV